MIQLALPSSLPPAAYPAPCLAQLLFWSEQKSRSSCIAKATVYLLGRNGGGSVKELDDPGGLHLLPLDFLPVPCSLFPVTCSLFPAPCSLQSRDVPAFLPAPWPHELQCWRTSAWSSTCLSSTTTPPTAGGEAMPVTYSKLFR